MDLEKFSTFFFAFPVKEKKSYVYECFSCMYVSVPYASMCVEEGVKSPSIGAMNGFELP